MKTNKITYLAACVGMLVSPLVIADNSEQIKASRTTIKAFAEQLQGELLSAMQAGGPVEAIGVCNIKAPEITENVSVEKGMMVSRTSLKLRNPQNAPDAWEQAALESFEQRKAAGEDVKMIDFSEVVETEAGKEFRYMKAIPTGEPCLTCHGTDINSEVAAKLGELYPEDKARGFKPGDIRGAFSVRQAAK